MFRTRSISKRVLHSVSEVNFVQANGNSLTHWTLVCRPLETRVSRVDYKFKKELRKEKNCPSNIYISDVHEYQFLIYFLNYNWAEF